MWLERNIMTTVSGIRFCDCVEPSPFRPWQFKTRAETPGELLCFTAPPWVNSATLRMRARLYFFPSASLYAVNTASPVQYRNTRASGTLCETAFFLPGGFRRPVALRLDLSSLF